MISLILEIKARRQLRRAQCKEMGAFSRHLKTYQHPLARTWHSVEVPAPPSHTHYNLARATVSTRGACLSFAFFVLSELLKATLLQQVGIAVVLVFFIYQSLDFIDRIFADRWVRYRTALELRNINWNT